MNHDLNPLIDSEQSAPECKLPDLSSDHLRILTSVFGAIEWLSTISRFLVTGARDRSLTYSLKKGGVLAIEFEKEISGSVKLYPNQKAPLADCQSGTAPVMIVLLSEYLSLRGVTFGELISGNSRAPIASERLNRLTAKMDGVSIELRWLPGKKGEYRLCRE